MCCLFLTTGFNIITYVSIFQLCIFFIWMRNMQIGDKVYFTSVVLELLVRRLSLSGWSDFFLFASRQFLPLHCTIKTSLQNISSSSPLIMEREGNWHPGWFFPWYNVYWLYLVLLTVSIYKLCYIREILSNW